MAYIHVENKRIYYEVVGERTMPAYLYLHGGPGTGAYDFMVLQGNRLSGFIQLIAMDQRGVLRSDPLYKDDGFSVRDIILDCEQLRISLGIDTWGIICHSFGGYLALEYAYHYPDVITHLIFENPTFDLADSARNVLERASVEYSSIGKRTEALECINAAQLLDPVEVWSRFSSLTNQLGELRNNLYVYGERKNFFDDLILQSGLSNEEWGRGSTHQRKLYEEGKVFQPVVELLKELKMPMTLLKGQHDNVTSERQMTIFLEGHHRESVWFESSGHFARFEQPGRYADTIKRVVNNLVTTSGSKNHETNTD